MILIFAVAFGLFATTARSLLTRHRLIYPSLRLGWLVWLAVIPQIFCYTIPVTAKLIPGLYLPYILVGSMAGLLIFTLANLLTPGFWLMMLGLASNLMAIISNGGWMPISPETLTRLHPERMLEVWRIGERLALSKDRILPQGNTNLLFLTDIFPGPSWLSYKFAFSIGDVILSAGVIIFLWSLSKQSRRTPC